MKLWHKQLIVFLLAGIVYVIGQYFRGEWFGSLWASPCADVPVGSTLYCHVPYLNGISWPLIDLGQMIFIIAVALFFVKEKLFDSWARFTFFYVLIAIFLTYQIFPISFGLWFGSGLVENYPKAVYLFGKPLVLITICMVLWGMYTEKRKKLRVR